MPGPKQLVVSFGKFWWEFLIGENPDAFIGALAVVGAAFLFRHSHAAAISIVPALAALFLIGSAYRGRRRAKAGS